MTPLDSFLVNGETSKRFNPFVYFKIVGEYCIHGDGLMKPSANSKGLLRNDLSVCDMAPTTAPRAWKINMKNLNFEAMYFRRNEIY